MLEAFGVFADPSPAQVSDRARLRALEEGFEGFADAMRAEWRQLKREVQKELEGLEDLAEVVEKKRKRIAASESRARQQQNGGTSEAAPDSEARMWADARNAGLL